MVDVADSMLCVLVGLVRIRATSPKCCCCVCAGLQAGAVSDGVYSGEVGLQIVPPLGSLRFIVEPRVLPLISSLEVRLDSSIKQMTGKGGDGECFAAMSSIV